MSRQNLPAQSVAASAAADGLSREAKIIAAVLFFAGALYVSYSGVSDTGLVRWLKDCQATLSGGYFYPKLTAIMGLAFVISVAAGVARLFDFLTGRGSHSAVKE